VRPARNGICAAGQLLGTDLGRSYTEVQSAGVSHKQGNQKKKKVPKQVLPKLRDKKKRKQTILVAELLIRSISSCVPYYISCLISCPCNLWQYDSVHTIII
jgi:hypothetical protein